MRNKFLSLIAGLCIAFSALPAFAYDPIDWADCTTVSVPVHAPNQNLGLFVNSYTGVGVPAGAWNTIDLSGSIPLGTKAVFLSGLLLITHGTNAETANLTAYFRRHGETYEYDYITQTIEAAIGNGQRSASALWVPVDETGKFDFKWGRTNTSNYPAFSAYGVNLSINAICK